MSNTFYKVGNKRMKFSKLRELFIKQSKLDKALKKLNKGKTVTLKIKVSRDVIDNNSSIGEQSYYNRLRRS